MVTLPSWYSCWSSVEESVFSDRIASISIAAALAAMVSIVAGGGASAQPQNTERELVDALQTMHRNAKEKKPKTKIKIAPVKGQPMMGDVRSRTGKMRDIGAERRRGPKRD
jgi:hypothetical protein